MLSTNTRPSPPVVMCCSGSDPSGGAGLLADAIAVLSMGCHPAPVTTAVTAQNSVGLIDFEPVAGALVVQQMRAVLLDSNVAAIKIGMLGSAEVAAAIHSVLNEHAHIPVVMDPVLATGCGQALGTEPMLEAMQSLIPWVTVLTPNAQEFSQLVPEAGSSHACAQALLDRGCDYVLVTGGDADTSAVVNLLYSKTHAVREFRWERIDARCHGTGCTLAAAIAALIGQGSEPVAAVRAAQKYTWESIRHSYVVGKGQRIPNRLFWTQ